MRKQQEILEQVLVRDLFSFLTVMKVINRTSMADIAKYIFAQEQVEFLWNILLHTS